MIGTALLTCTLKAAALLSVAWIAAFIIRRASAAVRHSVWVAAIICVGLLPLLQAIPFDWRDIRTAGELSGRPFNAAPHLTNHISSFVVDAIDSLPSHTNVNRWLIALWFAGVIAMLLRLLASLVTLVQGRRFARPCSNPGLLNEALRCANVIGLKRPIRILVLSTKCGMPSTFGLFRPIILLPGGCTQWTAQRVRIVLLHEMSHILRDDWAVGMFAQICLVMYWFHPLVWMATRRLREESECAADDFVLTAGQDATTYADELLEMIRNSFGSSAVPATAIAMARSNQLERRISAMLNETIDRRRLTWKAMLFTTTAALLALVPLSALQSPAQNSPGIFGGTVLDLTGAAVPAVTVIATNKLTRSRDMTATDLTGAYHFDGLPAGDYEIRFLKPGFAERRESSMLPTPGGSPRIITLELGSLSETINVVAKGNGNTVENTAPQRICDRWIGASGESD